MWLEEKENEMQMLLIIYVNNLTKLKQEING